MYEKITLNSIINTVLEAPWLSTGCYSNAICKYLGVSQPMKSEVFCLI